jgi:hypothetical protein
MPCRFPSSNPFFVAPAMICSLDDRHSSARIDDDLARLLEPPHDVDDPLLRRLDIADTRTGPMYSMSSLMS